LQYFNRKYFYNKKQINIDINSNSKGIPLSCMKTWTFSYDDKSFTDNILIVNSERKLLDDAKRRANQIKKFIEILEDLKSKLNKTIYKNSC
jgi:hypothetical protein